MSGKNLNLSPLESRKRLLLAESELNRAQMLREWQRLADEAHFLAHQAKTVGSLVAATASLVAGLRSLRCQKTAPASEKPSWWQTLIKGAGLLADLWPAFRPAGRD